MDIGFSTDRPIVVNADTIPAKTNLMKDNRILCYIDFSKNEEDFYNCQYVIRVNNIILGLKNYYTFYFKGVTESGYEINDSTIVYIY
jgi:hypothetical protein